MNYITENADLIFQNCNVFEEEYDKVNEARWLN